MTRSQMIAEAIGRIGIALGLFAIVSMLLNVIPYLTMGATP